MNEFEITAASLCFIWIALISAFCWMLWRDDKRKERRA